MNEKTDAPARNWQKPLAALLQATAALAAAGLLLLDSGLHGPLAALALAGVALAGLLYHRLPPILVELPPPAPASARDARRSGTRLSPDRETARAATAR